MKYFRLPNKFRKETSGLLCIVMFLMSLFLSPPGAVYIMELLFQHLQRSDFFFAAMWTCIAVIVYGE